MDNDVKPSSSEDLIASLISEVQQLKQPFDVTSLLPVRPKQLVKSSKSRTQSLSPKHEKKEKKRKEKRSRKSKKWKRTPSKSPLRKKKKRKTRSHSASTETLKTEEIVEPKTGSKSFVEAALERVSDDDDLPVGADFRTLSTVQESVSAVEVVYDRKPLSPDINKRREFTRSEEVFPLSKPRRKKDRSESPPMQKNNRPLSEILAKVRGEKCSSFVPRNVTLKQDVAKGNVSGTQRSCSPSGRPNQYSFGAENEEYGPVLAPCPSGPLPISEDEDDEATFSGRNDLTQPKVIKFGSLSQVTAKKLSEKGLFTEHSGEVPVSEDSTIEKDDLACSDEEVRSKRGDVHLENWREHRRPKHDKKRKKEKKRKKKEKKKQNDQASSSSDSEREWERLRKRHKMRYESISPRGSTFRYVVGSNDYKSFSHRGDGFEMTIGCRNVREKRLSLQREKIWRPDITKRRMEDKRRYHRRRSLSSSERRRSRTYSRSCSRSRNHTSGSSGRSSRSRSRNSSSERSSSEHKIDKKKLLEIAQKNAAQMAQLGYLPNAAPEVTARMKAGMQSVDQLVDFCQKLQRSQEKDEKAAAGRVSSDDEGLLPRKKKLEESSDFVKHPFALKSAAPITINITNAAPLPIKTSSQRTLEENQLRFCYPVSSGQQHREKDKEWVPVKKDLAVDKKNTAASKKQENKLGGLNGSFLLPPPPKPPVLLPHSSSAPSSLLTLPPPPAPPPSILLNNNNTSKSSTGTAESVKSVPTDTLTQSPGLNTPKSAEQFIGQRLEANRRLCENPNEFDAVKMLKEAEEQVIAWPVGKASPGQFAGSTGVHLVTVDRLGPEDLRFSAWGQKDLFKSVNKVSGDVGLRLMQKMGWTPGEGLGKCRDGPLEPLTLEIKSDRKGLVTVADLMAVKKQDSGGLLVEGKHPVSVLMELCTKKKWPAPQFTCRETGPSNNRRFLWKAVVNGVEYQPSLPSNTKKTGKAQACQVALQSLGIASKDFSCL